MKKLICLLMAIAMLVCCIPVSAFAADDAYYSVAGTDSLCGSGWNPADPSNQMTLNEETGLYEKTFENVPAGTHEFKVTDGSWSNSWGDNGGNYVFTTTEVKNIKITFNAETTEITVTQITIEPYYVAGTDALCGVGWDPGYADNKMSLNADGLYYKTFKSVPAGDHEFKVTNGTWDQSWGDNGGNYKLSTTEVHNVTIFFNAETTEITVELSEATEPDPVVPVEYPITVKVHYYREDAAYSDWEVHMWNGSGATTVSSTRAFELEDVEYEGTTYGATATYFTNSNETWVGFIVKKPDWTKDPDGDRHIDVSDVLSGTVHVYAKSGSALEDFDVVKDECVKGAKIIGAKWDSLTGVLTVTTSMPVEGDLMEAFTLEGPDGEIEITSVTKVEGASEYIIGYPEGAIAKDKAYKVHFNGASCDVTIPNTYSTKEFEAQYTYEGDDLGATWSDESTTFRVWAPTAAEVFVNLYESGTAGTDDLVESIEMTADVNGTWIATVEGDLNGVYYTYSVNVQGKVSEAVDPYARTTGVNGNRGMVVDLDSTDPAGWEDDDYVTQDSYTDAVIWELHVRDFSIDEASGMVNKGKYLAFTESGTTVPDTDIATGVDYMVDLGVNYVHLLPVYDINSVDEATDGYNWGYDPKNYNVPEGSYSTDPYDGAVRVTEFKQMVQSLHDNGIGVIMDVVYNHVADAGEFCFNKIVPGYFSRIHDDGSYQSNSGCGNDTASERSMVSKYIVDSVLYWCEEYHIDGFRWDLVGLIDYETINAVMEAVHEVNPEIIFYGEGWEMCSWTTKDEGDYASDPYSKKMTIQPNDQKVNTEAGVFAFFNDTIRNVIHGGVFTATDKGFVAGNMNEGTKETVTLGYMGNSNWGSDNASVDTPLQTINYASCHDNYTLFDNLTVDAMDATGLTAAEVAGMAAEMNNLAAAYYITAQGVPFIHAGEEMLRSKPDDQQENGFNHNSYASGDAINSFKWGSLEEQLNAASYEYYKGLIAFRKDHPALRMTTEAEIAESMSVLDTGNVKVVALMNNGGSVEDQTIISIFNADAETCAVSLPEGIWEIHVDKYTAGTECIDIAEGQAWVEATSAMILVEHECEYEDSWCPVCGTQDPGYVKTPELLLSNIHPTGKILVEWKAVEDAVKYELSVYDDDMELINTVITAKTSIKHTSAEAGEEYYYSIVAIDAEGNRSEPSRLEPFYCKYAAPKLSASIIESTGKIQLNWTAVEDAEKYDLLICDADGNLIRTYSTTKTTVKHTSAVAGETYTYKVLAWEDEDITSATSDPVVIKCLYAAPKVTASNVAKTGKVKLTWTAVEGAAKYKVYRATEESGSYKLMFTTANTSYTNTSAEAGVTYYYKVVAVDAEGNALSAKSAPKARTCDLAQPKVTASVTAAGNPKLTWKAVDGAVKYKVYRAESADGQFKLMKTTTNTSYTNTSNVAGTTYFYKVVAVAEVSAANSAASAVVSATAK